MVFKFLHRNYKKEGKLAQQLLNAVWDEDIHKAKRCLRQGADPNWIYNGYPILLHAVFTRNITMVMTLLDAGATQGEEALGFALDRGIGELVCPLAFLGIIPRWEEPKAEFGPYPSRYAPLDLQESYIIL